MDPYLEGARWMSVHSQLAAEIARQLVPKLRPKYIVQPVTRYVWSTPDDIGIKLGGIIPDVGIAEQQWQPTLTHTGVAIAPPTLEMATVTPEKTPLVVLEIRDRELRDLVTAIEILSPTNKRGEGYDEYVEKRQNLLRSRVHLLEIDLLRKGKRVPMVGELPDTPYFVFLSRSDNRPITQIWAIRLQDTLPIVPIPLLPEDDDVPLDLQSAFNEVYDGLGFDYWIDYSSAPDVPLKRKYRKQVAELLN